MLINCSHIRTAIVGMLLCLRFGSAIAQDDPSQRPLPLPERGVADLPQHMELLKRLRSLVESQQKDSEQGQKDSDTLPRLPALPSPAEAPASKQKTNQTAPEISPSQPQQLQQFQEALKNLASKLPPGFVPPDLSSVPPDQLRKAMENPAVQQQMKQMLEQFAKDGVLPKPGDNASQLPVPPQNDERQNESGTSQSATADSAKDAPSGSMRSLRSFLKKLAEDTGMKSPDSAQDTSSQNELDSRAAANDKTIPAEPKNSLGINSAPSPRRPLRKRETAKPKTSPSADSSISPSPNENGNPSGQFPETSPNPLNPPNTSPAADDRENSPDADFSVNSPMLSDPSISNPPQGMRIDPETARKQLEDLQKTLERMKQLAEESNSGRSTPEERPSSERQPSRSDSNDNNRVSDSNSVVPSPSRDNRSANRPDSDNINGEVLPESLPDVDEFLREQLKNFKLPPDAVPGSNSGNSLSSNGMNPLENSRGTDPPPRTPDNRLSRYGSPSDLYMERPPQQEDIRRLKESLHPGNTDRSKNDPSDQGNAKSAESEKPPIDIAKELEQGGFGNTLKKLIERGKEEAKKPRPPAQDSADVQGLASNAKGDKSAIENALNGATEAAKKADPELSKSMAKMLDGLKDDLVRIAKDAKFNDPPERTRGDRSTTRPSPSESNSMIDTLRKSASEILAGPSRSSNAGNSAASGASAAALNAFSGEFDFTPVMVLAGALAALAIAFFGLRHVKLRSAYAAELQFAGPPLKPSEINSRADVVRAFHEFAMRSAQSVQSWWTHRTVQKAILEKSPEYRMAVETLANTYEQARYLPVEQELSPEQLESARSALQQFSRKNSNG